MVAARDGGVIVLSRQAVDPVYAAESVCAPFELHLVARFLTVSGVVVREREKNVVNSRPRDGHAKHKDGD